jgi:hypothetical protein
MCPFSLNPGLSQRHLIRVQHKATTLREMKRYSLLVVFSVTPLLLAVVCGATAIAQAPQQTEIPADQLVAHVQVIGRLGHPLGTKLKIIGSVPEHLGKTTETFEVKEVNGKLLKEHVFVAVRGQEIKPGVEYTLEGYETGAFSNDPQWGRGSSAPIEFQFWTWFLVVKTTSDFPPQ